MATTSALILLSGSLLLLDHPSLWILGLVGLIYAGYVAVTYPRRYLEAVRKVAEERLSEGNFGKALGSHQVTFREEAVECDSPLGRSAIPWTSFEGFALTEEHLLLFLPGPQGIALRRSQMSSEIFEAVRATVEERLEPLSS